MDYHSHASYYHNSYASYALVEWIISKVLCAGIIAPCENVEMHSMQTCVHNCTNYYEQGSCCISLKPRIASDLITITTVYLVMMVIRTIAVMIRVLFPGSSLPLCVFNG